MINVIRAHLAEFGIVAPVGRRESSCLTLSLMQATNGCPWLHGCVWQRWGLNCAGLRDLEFDR